MARAAVVVDTLATPQDTRLTLLTMPNIMTVTVAISTLSSSTFMTFITGSEEWGHTA